MYTVEVTQSGWAPEKPEGASLASSFPVLPPPRNGRTVSAYVPTHSKTRWRVVQPTLPCVCNHRERVGYYK